MPDAKEWEKVAENIVKTRKWLYSIIDDATINSHVIAQITYLLSLALEEIDKLAQLDDKGWL